MSDHFFYLLLVSCWLLVAIFAYEFSLFIAEKMYKTPLDNNDENERKLTILIMIVVASIFMPLSYIVAQIDPKIKFLLV